MHRLGLLTLISLLATPAAAADPDVDALIRELQQQRWFKLEASGAPGTGLSTWGDAAPPARPPPSATTPYPSPNWGQSEFLFPRSRLDPAPTPPATSTPPQPTPGLPRADQRALPTPPASAPPSSLPSWVRLPNQTESAAIAIGSYQAFKLSKLATVAELNAELIAKGVEKSHAEKAAPYLFRVLNVRGVGAATLGVAITASGIFIYDWFAGDDDKKK